VKGRVWARRMCGQWKSEEEKSHRFWNLGRRGAMRSIQPSLAFLRDLQSQDEGESTNSSDNALYSPTPPRRASSRNYVFRRNLKKVPQPW
jgi:hypothetical protein